MRTGGLAVLDSADELLQRADILRPEGHNAGLWPALPGLPSRHRSRRLVIGFDHIHAGECHTLCNTWLQLKALCFARSAAAPCACNAMLATGMTVACERVLWHSLRQTTGHQAGQGWQGRRAQVSCIPGPQSCLSSHKIQAPGRWAQMHTLSPMGLSDISGQMLVLSSSRNCCFRLMMRRAGAGAVSELAPVRRTVCVKLLSVARDHRPLHRLSTTCIPSLHGQACMLAPSRQAYTTICLAELPRYDIAQQPCPQTRVGCRYAKQREIATCSS